MSIAVHLKSQQLPLRDSPGGGGGSGCIISCSECANIQPPSRVLALSTRSRSPSVMLLREVPVVEICTAASWLPYAPFPSLVWWCRLLEQMLPLEMQFCPQFWTLLRSLLPQVGVLLRSHLKWSTRRDTTRIGRRTNSPLCSWISSRFVSPAAPLLALLPSRFRVPCRTLWWRSSWG